MTMDSDAPEDSENVAGQCGDLFRRHVEPAPRGYAPLLRRGSKSATMKQTLAVWAYADIRRADSPSGMLRLAARPRRRWRGWRFATRALARRTDLALRADWTTTRPAAAASPPSSAGRSRPRFRSLPWCCSAAADRRPPRAAGAGGVRAAARRGRRQPGQDDVRWQGLRQRRRAEGLRQARQCASANTPASTPRCSRPCCRSRFPMPSRCRAARSICSTACWRRRKTPTRSPACWPMSSAISSIATACAG